MRRFIILILCWVLLGSPVAFGVTSTILADTKNGLILSAYNSKLPQHPASLTKVMTLYLTFNAIENGLLSMEDFLPVSLHAAKQPASKLYLKAGETIRVKDAIHALIVKSANDAAVVLAEALAPSEVDFAKMMTQVAKELGLKNTVFRNASGLHHPEQVTTARDMALLTIALINHFPQYYDMFDMKEFTYKGKVYQSHNYVTRYYKGAEGLKTGYISAVGFNIISTAKRGDSRLVTVVIGHKTSKQRDRQAVRLLDRGFSMVKSQKSVLKKLKQKGQELDIRSVAVKPSMKSHLKTMERRLAFVRRMTDNLQDIQLAKLEQSGQLNKLLPVKLASQEIQQGDNDEILSNVHIASNHISYVSSFDATSFEGQNILDANHNDIPVSNDGASVVVSEKSDSTVLDNNDMAVVSQVNQTLEKGQILQTTQTVQNSDDVLTNRTQQTTLSSDTMGMRRPTWGVQVGAFSQKTAAQKQAEKAYKIVKGSDKFVKIIKSDKFYRSRIYGFKTKQDANMACRRLQSKKMNCMTLQPISL